MLSLVEGSRRWQRLQNAVVRQTHLRVKNNAAVIFWGNPGRKWSMRTPELPKLPPRLGRLQQCQARQAEAGDTSRHICWDLTISLRVVGCVEWPGGKGVHQGSKQAAANWMGACPVRSQREWMGSAARAEMGVKLGGRTYGQGSPPEKCWHSPQDLAQEAQSIINAILSCLFNEKAKITICFCK